MELLAELARQLNDPRARVVREHRQHQRLAQVLERPANEAVGVSLQVEART
jgi:hypothetical protein